MREEVHIEWENITDPYERLAIIGRQLIKTNPDATFYDLFNYIREDIFKGWKIDEDTPYIRRIDVEIEQEWKKHGYR